MRCLKTDSNETQKYPRPDGFASFFVYHLNIYTGSIRSIDVPLQITKGEGVGRWDPIFLSWDFLCMTSFLGVLASAEMCSSNTRSF